MISGIAGFNFQNRDEIIQRIIKNYRNGKIENLLGVLGWNLASETNTSNTFQSLFTFE